MRPIQHLPVPHPKDFDPSVEDKNFFYNNFAKHFIKDMIKMMDVGLYVDSIAVEKLRSKVDNVLESVNYKLSKSILIKKFRLEKQSDYQKAHFDKSTKSVRTLDHYLKPYNPSNIIHRTWVVNNWLNKTDKEEYCKDKWSLPDLKKLQIFLNDPFIQSVIDKRVSEDNIEILSGMKKLAEYKLNLWNRPRYEKANSKVKVPDFNPGSSIQIKQFFNFVNVKPLAFSNKTGEPSWGREQLEILRNETSSSDLIYVLDALIDYSYSAIIRNNFLAAFDKYTVDGVLHGNIVIFGAKSCRNTSNSPNLLNAPSTGSIYAKPLKKCFIAPKNKIIYTADLSALEDRVIANLSGDKNKCNIFLENLDGHSLNSCVYFADKIEKIIGPETDFIKFVRKFTDNVETNEVIEKIRQDSKAPTFKLAYGGYPDYDKGGVITQEIFDNYHNVLYPGITDYRENYVLPTAQKNGYIHLGLGCRLYTNNPYDQIRTLNNSTVQFWSILTLIAINEFNYRIEQENLTPYVEVCSTIYDSVYSYVVRDAEVVKWVNDNLIELMTIPYLEDEIIHNEAVGEIGNNWADLHKIKNNASVEDIKEITDRL